MNKKEKIKYTKRCAEFLGMHDYSKENSYFEKDKYFCYPEKNKNPQCGFFTLDNSFLDDWNWIMKVIEKIESLDFSKLGYSWEIDGETQYNNQNIYVEIERKKCMIYMDLQLDPFYIYTTQNGNSKKEATTKAINEFLIQLENKKIPTQHNKK